MVDGCEKRKRKLAFELQNSRVYEKRSNALLHSLAALAATFSAVAFYFYL